MMPDDRPAWQEGQRHSQTVKQGWYGQMLDGGKELCLAASTDC